MNGRNSWILRKSVGATQVTRLFQCTPTDGTISTTAKTIFSIRQQNDGPVYHGNRAKTVHSNKRAHRDLRTNEIREYRPILYIRVYITQRKQLCCYHNTHRRGCSNTYTTIYFQGGSSAEIKASKAGPIVSPTNKKKECYLRGTGDDVERKIQQRSLK